MTKQSGFDKQLGAMYGRVSLTESNPTQEDHMTITAVDPTEWLHAIEHDRRHSPQDVLVSRYYAADPILQSAEWCAPFADPDDDLTDEQIQESYEKLYAHGYFKTVLVLDEQAKFDCRFSLPAQRR